MILTPNHPQDPRSDLLSVFPLDVQTDSPADKVPRIRKQAVIRQVPEEAGNRFTETSLPMKLYVCPGRLALSGLDAYPWLEKHPELRFTGAGILAVSSLVPPSNTAKTMTSPIYVDPIADGEQRSEHERYVLLLPRHNRLTAPLILFFFFFTLSS